MDLFDRINKLKEEGLNQINQAENQKMLDKIRVELMGRKGELTQILHSMKDIAPENRPKVGQEVNQVRDLLQKQLDEAKNNFLQTLIAKKLEEEKIYSRQGNVFSLMALKEILTNPVYCKADQKAREYFYKKGEEITINQIAKELKVAKEGVEPVIIGTVVEGPERMEITALREKIAAYYQIPEDRITILD